MLTNAVLSFFNPQVPPCSWWLFDISLEADVGTPPPTHTHDTCCLSPLLVLPPSSGRDLDSSHFLLPSASILGCLLLTLTNSCHPPAKHLVVSSSFKGSFSKVTGVLSTFFEVELFWILLISQGLSLKVFSFMKPPPLPSRIKCDPAFDFSLSTFEISHLLVAKKCPSTALHSPSNKVISLSSRLS